MRFHNRFQSVVLLAGQICISFAFFQTASFDNIKDRNENIGSMFRLQAEKSETTDASSVAKEDIKIDGPLPMGISQELYELKLGNTLTKKIENPNADRTSYPSSSTRSIEITKLSHHPPIFHINGALAPDEARALIEFTKGNEMEQAQTRIGGDDSNNYRQGSQMCWLPNHTPTEELGGMDLQSLSQSIHEIFLPFEEQPLHPQFSVEELQAVRYDPQGEFRLHHDGALRILTVLYYLNGVSDTWFPLADYGQRMANREEALKVAAGLPQPDTHSPSTDQSEATIGVRVSSKEIIRQPGEAIAFYNYFQDATVDWNAIHAGLPAESEKWIATHWYHHVPPSKGLSARK